MWQRIQTLYLVLSILFLSLIPALQVNLAMAQPLFWGGIGLAGISVVLTVWGIFQFLNRKKQLSTVRIAAIVAFLAVGLCKVAYLITTPQVLWMNFIQNPAILWGIGGAFLGFVFQLLALYAIRKDENLVRSMDRLR